MDYPKPVVIIDGMPRSGKTTLANALRADLGGVYINAQAPPSYAYVQLEHTIQGSGKPGEPLILDVFHLTAAAQMSQKETDLNALQWATLDDLLTRRDPILI